MVVVCSARALFLPVGRPRHLFFPPKSSLSSGEGKETAMYFTICAISIQVLNLFLFLLNITPEQALAALQRISA